MSFHLVDAPSNRLGMMYPKKQDHGHALDLRRTFVDIELCVINWYLPLSYFPITWTSKTALATITMGSTRHC